MTQEFCQHLDKYSQLYRGADEAYRTCVELMDEIMAGSEDTTLVSQLASSLNNWEKQTRNLRSTFVSLKDRGHVLLPREGQNANPVCGHCGYEVPRLEFPEFEFTEEGMVTFRGEQLEIAEPAVG
jgi:hypothetical protein